MKLPTIESVQGGHFDHHDALKAEYDARHPDTPLPELGGGLIDGRQSHEVIHELLAADHNEITNGDLPTDLTPVTFGHLKAHNALHAAYNERVREAS